MKAIIFAAGMGTRLKPFTNNKPKILVKVGDRSVFDLIVSKLIEAGVSEIVVNVHHHAQILKDYISGLRLPEVQFHISDESEALLDTGGGLKHAQHFFNDGQSFYAYNGDILSGIDLSAMHACHIKSGALATLAVSNRHTSRYFLWDAGVLVGWENAASGQTIYCNPEYRPGPDMERKAFSGIALIHPAIFGLMTESGSFSIKDVYLRLAASHPIQCFQHEESSWAETGSHEGLERARKLYAGS
jgi:N-acetyl-alpha-D-muramate 1-phosphate uridylyltransferase